MFSYTIQNCLFFSTHVSFIFPPVVMVTHLRLILIASCQLTRPFCLFPQTPRAWSMGITSLAQLSPPRLLETESSPSTAPLSAPLRRTSRTSWILSPWTTPPPRRPRSP